MQDGMGLRLRTAVNADLKAGDMVEVVGIPELSGPSPQLCEAVARRIGTAHLPTAISWADLENSGKNAEAMLVQTTARLIEIRCTGSECILELQAGLRAFRARVKASESLAEAFPLGSRLNVSGVYATMIGERAGDFPGFELLLNSRADIRLLERPSWWTCAAFYTSSPHLPPRSWPRGADHPVAPAGGPTDPVARARTRAAASTLNASGRWKAERSRIAARSPRRPRIQPHGNPGAGQHRPARRRMPWPKRRTCSMRSATRRTA